MKSGMMVIIGISMRPNQNTAVENSIMYIPAMTLPTGITGQKKLQKYEEVYIIKKLFLKSVFFFYFKNYVNNVKFYKPVHNYKDEPQNNGSPNGTVGWQCPRICYKTSF